MEVHSEEHRKELRHQFKRQLRTAKKYVLKTMLQLDECKKAEHEQHTAELLQAFLYKIKKGDRSVTAEDWMLEGRSVHIELNPRLSPHEEVAARFKKAKKLKKGLPFAEIEYAKAIKNLEEVTQRIHELEAIEDEALFEAFAAKHRKPPPPTQEEKEEERLKPYNEFELPDGTIVWAGKSAAGNDALTFSHARGNDLWAHATGVSGSHVVIRLKKGQEINPEMLQEALKIALYHSKARQQGEGEVTVTLVKHVKRFGKTKGKVQVAQEKRHFIRLEKGYSSSVLKR